MGTFNDMTKRVQNSPLIVIVFATFLLLFGISIVLMVEDYQTSLYGYQMVPTNKVNPNLGFWVALLPQAIQVALTYLGIEKRNPWYIIAAGVALMLDISTDVYFKSFGWQTTELVMIATLESFVLYTLGSEVLFVLSGGALWSLIKPLNAYVKGRRRTSRRDEYHQGTQF